ncbi:amidohydrolase family protein [Pikeienuella piscinae]|nr:amidohydrolase family protein [Pikeienuella piscinae]
MMAGAMWRYPYVGYHDRIDTDGKLWPGLSAIDDVISGLKKAAKAMTVAGEPPEKPLFAWGFDPIFLPTERLNRRHLDAVSATRPIVVQHSNFHLLTANSPALALAGYTRETNVTGVAKGPDGELNGELQEMAAMFPLMRRVGVDFRALSAHLDSIKAFASIARQTGTTTMTDLHAELPDKDLATLFATTGAADLPLRIVPMLGAAMMPPKEVGPRALELRAKATDMLRLGGVKLVLDGSIQGYTARLRWPYHVNGAPNGIWVIAPEQAEELILEPREAEAPNASDHDHAHGHDHGAAYRSWSTTGGYLTRADLEALLNGPPAGLFRFKGRIALKGGGAVKAHLVGRLHELTPCDAAPTRAVAIGLAPAFEPEAFRLRWDRIVSPTP